MRVYKFVVLIVVICLSLIFNVSGKNKIPVISNVRIEHDANLNKKEIYFDLFDAEDDSVAVTLEYFPNESQGFLPVPGQLSGDCSGYMLPGSDKHITWHYGETGAGEADLRLVADDSYVIPFEELRQQIDTMGIKTRLRQISSERNYFSESAASKLEEVKALINEYFLTCGLTPYKQDTILIDFKIDEDVVQDLPVENLVAEHPGLYPSLGTYIMGAHFDSARGTQGANDNASGLVAMLEVARILAAYSFRYSLRFIAFDNGKLGYLGSRFYAINGIHKYENIKGVINLDMVGHYSEMPGSQSVPDGYAQLFPEEVLWVQRNGHKGNFIMLAANDASDAMARNWRGMIEQHGLGLHSLIITDRVSIAGQSPLAFSDHSIFWRKGYRAVYIGDTGDTRSIEGIENGDTEDLIDYQFMYKVVEATLAFMMRAGDIRHHAIVVIPGRSKE